MDALCQIPDSQNKIKVIATGILRKNYKFVHRLEEVETRAKQLAQRLNHSKEQMDILKLQLSNERHSTYYKISSDSVTAASPASLIADAILNDPQAVQLVARLDGNFLEMDKTWELMSELDKDEIIRKKIIREL
ncbi:MAG: hypothetical protein II857_12220 [Selenomonadaceae bacterium]|nr:hypothetical protein [Selenomonadaceae bacterium]